MPVTPASVAATLYLALVTRGFGYVCIGHSSFCVLEYDAVQDNIAMQIDTADTVWLPSSADKEEMRNRDSHEGIEDGEIIPVSIGYKATIWQEETTEPQEDDLRRLVNDASDKFKLHQNMFYTRKAHGYVLYEAMLRIGATEGRYSLPVTQHSPQERQAARYYRDHPKPLGPRPDGTEADPILNMHNREPHFSDLDANELNLITTFSNAHTRQMLRRVSMKTHTSDREATVTHCTRWYCFVDYNKRDSRCNEVCLVRQNWFAVGLVEALKEIRCTLNVHFSEFEVVNSGNLVPKQSFIFDMHSSMWGTSEYVGKTETIKRVMQETVKPPRRKRVDMILELLCPYTPNDIDIIDKILRYIRLQPMLVCTIVIGTEHKLDLGHLKDVFLNCKQYPENAPHTMIRVGTIDYLLGGEAHTFPVLQLYNDEVLASSDEAIVKHQFPHHIRMGFKNNGFGQTQPKPTWV